MARSPSGHDEPNPSGPADAARWDPFDDPPKRIGKGRFELQQRIAVGGMGEVFLAQDHHLGDTCAVKVYEQRVILRSNTNAERFLAEARAMAALRHPHIVRIRDAGADGAFLWYAMDHLPRGSIWQVMDLEGCMDPLRSLRIAFEVLSALAVVHGAGLVHRDVKPGNILLDDKGRTALADFGIARHPDGTVAFRTISGTGMGTRGYAAPEQDRDARNVGPASDLYSVAAVLFEMLTGESPSRLLFLALEPSMLAGVPEPVHPLLLRGAAADPAARYPTAYEMSAAVASAAGEVSGDAVLAARWMAEQRAPRPSSPRKRRRLLR